MLRLARRLAVRVAQEKTSEIPPSGCLAWEQQKMQRRFEGQGFLPRPNLYVRLLHQQKAIFMLREVDQSFEPWSMMHAPCESAMGLPASKVINASKCHPLQGFGVVAPNLRNSARPIS